MTLVDIVSLAADKMSALPDTFVTKYSCMALGVVQALVGEQLVQSGQLAAQQVLGPSPP